LTQVIFSLGSNVGNGQNAIESALGELSIQVQSLRASSLYRSAPMYVTDQPPFLNAVAIGQTDLGPLPLLHLVKQIEQDLGRVSRYRWGPREIDIDIVAYGSLRYRFRNEGEVRLEIPHARFHERRFVLVPLVEVCPDCIIPGKGNSSDLLAQTEAQSGDVVKVTHELLSVRSKG
jgi:2-amino-4-hydroxy-6-hydroxymethyldihydropteridine diphosphokinase